MRSLINFFKSVKPIYIFIYLSLIFIAAGISSYVLNFAYFLLINRGDKSIESFLPILSSYKVFLTIADFVYKNPTLYLSVTALLTGIPIFMIIFYISFKQRKKKVCNHLIIMLIISSALILVALSICCGKNFYYLIPYYYTNKIFSENFNIFFIGMFIIYFILIIFIYIFLTFNFFIIFLDKNTNVYYFLYISSFAIIISILAFFAPTRPDKDNFLAFSKLEKYSPKNQRWLLTIRDDGTVFKDLVKDYVEFENNKFALNKHNYKVFFQFDFKSYGNKEFISFFMFRYCSYNLLWNDLEKFSITNYIESPLNDMFNIAFSLGSLRYRYKPDKETLNKIETIYNERSMYVSEDSLCTLAFVQYKLGKYKEAKINANRKTNGNNYCEITQKLLSGKIKQTTITGILIENNKPVAGNKIFLSNLFNKSSTKICTYNGTDQTQTDSYGKFILNAETDQPVYLVVVSNRPKKISFDYKKLFGYKQGSTINLGKVSIND